jgi:hypothetical protein
MTVTHTNLSDVGQPLALGSFAEKLGRLTGHQDNRPGEAKDDENNDVSECSYTISVNCQ